MKLAATYAFKAPGENVFTAREGKQKKKERKIEQHRKNMNKAENKIAISKGETVSSRK